MEQTITNTIFELRTAKGLTQEDLADAVGVTRQTIIAIEKGNYTPSLPLAFKLATYFHKSIEEVFTYGKK